VAAIYPAQGAIVATYPLATLQGNGLTPSKSAAVLRLRDFLISQPEQAKAVQYGFRPASAGMGLAAPTHEGHGVNPEQSNPGLPIPAIDVLQTLQTNWVQERRPFGVMLLVDTS